MRRVLRILVVLALVAALPLRAVAGATVGYCASGHKDMSVEAHAANHGHKATDHGSHEAPAEKSPLGDSCNICAEHCSSAAFAPPSGPAVSMQPRGNDQPFFAVRIAPAFVPDQPDRPPLA